MMTPVLERVEVVTLGEVLVGLVAADHGPLRTATTFQRHVVGAESNLAIGLSRLGHRCAFVGRVGDDAFGHAAVMQLRAEAVDVSQVTTVPDAPTGVLVRERRGVGASEVLYRRTGSAGSQVGPDDVARAKDLVAEADWLHLTGITPALSASADAAVQAAVALARDLGRAVSLDLNVRRKLWSPEQAAPVLRALAASSDLVLGGEDEVLLVTGASSTEAAAQLLLESGPATVVVKQGEAGATAYTRDAAPVHAPALVVDRPVDVVGAGDAFAAGYLAGVLEGLSLQDRLELGNVCGAFAVSCEGDVTGLPTRAEASRSAHAQQVLR